MPFATRGTEQSFGKRSIDPIRNLLRTASTTSPVAIQSFALNKPRRKMSRLRLQANARRLGRRGDAACVHRTVDQAVDQSQLKPKNVDPVSIETENAAGLISRNALISGSLPVPY
jgi:hypothetical protein